MKTLATLILSTVCGFSAIAQTTITNGGFESWGNASPGVAGEPTTWYSDKSGSSIASIGPVICFKDSTDQHSGSYCVKIVTTNYLGTAVNGVVTTGVVNAPSFSKSSGYIGTVNYSSSTDDRRMPFTGRPDSLVGWYKYTPGGAGEMGKIRAILHTGDYYDPETPTTDHPDPTANRIADDTFYTPTTTVATWTRFSIPFTYVSTLTPTYIMINITSSANQTTTISGSTMWIDDLEAVYVAAPCDTVAGLAASAITATTATISWTAVSGSAGYVYAVDNSATAPGSGTFTTATSIPVTGLTASTAYYAHVYDSCAVGSVSGWVTVPFTTLSSTAGVANVAGAAFSVSAFPNPVKDELTINITGAAGKTGTAELMDISGKVINSIVTGSSSVNMSMKGLPAGNYFVRYIDAAHTQTIKINKQ